jgi:hypothetical protein
MHATLDLGRLIKARGVYFWLGGLLGTVTGVNWSADAETEV